VAYLTAQITLTLAGFKAGVTVLLRRSRSVGNATYQLARGAGRRHGDFDQPAARPKAVRHASLAQRRD